MTDTKHDRAIQEVVHAYLRASDQEAHGLVEGLYLTGSVALGDFHPRHSDIDFVAVTARAPTAAAVAALRRTHVRLRRQHPRPHFDGCYVTWEDLKGEPGQAPPAPFVEEGRFRASGIGERNPVTWHLLAQCGVACTGPAPADLRIWTDAAALKRWTLDNLESYWRPLVRRARRFPDRWVLGSLTAKGAAWMVLGVCRLHFTLATGEIASKGRAGAYGLKVFEESWQRVLQEALRIRRAGGGRSMYSSPAARRREVLSFVEMAIADAQQRFGAAERLVSVRR